MELKFEKLIIDLKINNLDRAVDFYQNILKLPLIHKDVDWASLEAMGAEIHLYLHSGISSGLEFRVVNLESYVDNLKKLDIQFFVEENQVNLLEITGDVMKFPWGKSAFFNDSEGNRIVLVEDK